MTSNEKIVILMLANLMLAALLLAGTLRISDLERHVSEIEKEIYKKAD